MGKKNEKHESSSKNENELDLDLGRSIMDINAIRQTVVSEDFEDNKGKKALVTREVLYLKEQANPHSKIMARTNEK